MTQRGRGEHLFWIHTQSPPPDFGLSDPRRDRRCKTVPSGTKAGHQISSRSTHDGISEVRRARAGAPARAPPRGGTAANKPCTMLDGAPILRLSGADRSKSQSRGYELVSPGDPTCTERLRGFIGYSARRACADRDGHGAWRGGAKLCGSAKMGDGVNRSSVRRVMSCLVYCVGGGEGGVGECRVP